LLMTSLLVTSLLVTLLLVTSVLGAALITTCSMPGQHKSFTKVSETGHPELVSAHPMIIQPAR
jgi:hypothetical protein